MKRTVFLLLAVLTSVLGVTPVSAQSWLSPWAERVPVTISNSGAQLTNYQTELKLDSKFRFVAAAADGSDLRVVQADGVTALPFWIQDWNSAAQKATIYVKLPTLDVGPTLIYLYYGNPGVPTASDADSVFDFYDGFEAPFTTNSVTPLQNAPTYQITPTYEGSGQIVHPGIVYFPGGWNSWKYWLVVTPYPGSNATYENPSILVSNDGASWQVPAGLTNPIAIHTGEPNLADGELYYDDVSNSLWVYYNQDYVSPGTLGYRKISDGTGINWGAEQTILELPQHDLLSQAVLKINTNPTTYGMWYVNTGPGGCTGQSNVVEYRTSSDGMSWSDPTTLTTFSIPGYQVWHPEVIYVPSKSEYWALVAAYPNGSGCASTSLFFAKSSDGITWTTYGTPALAPGADWDSTEIYRSTFLYDEGTDMLRVWYSALGNSQWHLGYTERKYTDFLADLTAASSTSWTTSGAGEWTQSTEQVKRDANSAKLVQESGSDYYATHAQPDATNFYQEWDMYDDMSSSAFKVVRVSNGASKVGIGVYTGCSPASYCYHNTAYSYTASVARSLGWHKFGIRLDSNSVATFLVDGVQVGSLAGQFNSAGQISVEGYSSLPTTYYIDDVRIRQSAATEPNISVGSAEDENQSKPPVAQDDSFSTRAGTALTVSAPGVLNNDTDPQLYPLSATAVSVPTSGTLLFNGDGSFTYTPNQGFTGVDSFTYVANNGHFNSNAATVTIAISGWMDQNWGDRRSVSISNPCGGTCSNYQVHITLDSSFDFSKALPDGGDLRVSASDGSTLIPFWIESWDAVAKQASLWVKVPTIPSGGTIIYLYYGNATPPPPPGPTVVNLPPVGPWTIPSNNLIAPIGDPGSGSQLIAENIVYDDPATGGDGKYWLVFANYRDSSVALAWSDTPADPQSWHWNSGNPVVTTANAPFLIKDGSTWYIFFADRSHGTSGQLDMRIATASSPGGPYTRVAADTSITGSSVTLTSGSMAMVGVGTSFTTQLTVGQFVKMSADATSAWIQICAITSPTSATLCNRYTGNGGTGAAQFNAGGIVLWPTEAWESWRVDEPYVMKMPDNTYMLMYMADSGGNVEQNGYATAPAITGPYTKYAGNPALPFGAVGSYDHGTVADPWIFPIGNTYYIGYAASPTSSSPWHTGLVTTTDFLTFNREGVTLTTQSGGNAFRGGVTRVGNMLVFTYGADSYDSRLATQPATATVGSIINNPHAVFDFYDDFSGSFLDATNWALSTTGTGGSATLNGGVLSLTAQSTTGNSGIVELLGPATIGRSSLLEVRGRHLDAGLNPGTQSNTAFELGFATADLNNTIRLMDFPDLTNYTVQAKKLGTGSYMTSAVNFDQAGSWHTYQLYRDSTSNAAFSVDGTLVATVGANLPDWKLPPMLMSYANDPAPQSRFQVEWVRVRQAAGSDPGTTTGEEELPSGDHTPTAYGQSVSTPHDVPVTITLTASDLDNDPLTYSVASGPTHGSLSGSAPNLTYTPAPNYHGNDAFTFRAFDGQGYSNPATISIAVTYVNHAPIANGQSVSVDQDSAAAITLSATDPDLDPLTYAVMSGPSHGTLSGTAPNLTYTPAPLYYGPDSFLFKANDGMLDSNVATITITVDRVNHAPVASNDSYSAIAGKALSIVAPGLLSNDTDVDGDILAAILVSGPAHGSLVLYPNGSLRYLADIGYSGSDSFTYKVNDGVADSNVATVFLNVTGWFDVGWTDRRPVAISNPCPGACSSFQVQIKLDSTNFNFANAKTDGSDVLVTDSDAVTPVPFWIENWNSVSQTASIWVNVASIPTGGTTLYLYYGNSDPLGRTNDPSLVFDFYDAFNGTTVDATKWTTNLTVGSFTVSNGIVVLASTNNYTQLLGKSTFASGYIFEVYGLHENQGVATALLAVGWRIGTADWNNATRLMDWRDTGDETKYHAASSGGNTTNLFSGYKDSTTAADKNWHTFGVYRSTAGTADFRVDGNSVVNPLIGSPYVLTSAMSMWIGTYASGTTSKFDVDWARVRKFYGSDPSVTVGTEKGNTTNRAPSATDDAYSVPQDNTLAVSNPGVLANDSDPDSDLLTAVLVTDPSHGAVTLNPMGSFVYVPATGFHGADSFSYKASDGVLNSNVATVSINVTMVAKQDQAITFGALGNKTYGDAPFAVSATASSGLAVSFSVGGSDSCTVAGDMVTITGAGNCTVTAHQAGDATYNAAPDVAQSFTIAKATASIQLSNLSQSYDGTAKAAAASTTPSGLGVSLTYDGATTAPSGAGSYAVDAVIQENNYQGSATGTLVIARALASVTPNAAGKVYGTSDPVLSGTLSGFFVADNVTAAYSRTAGETVAGSPYTISATLSPGGVLGNYNISYNTAQFSISPADPLIVWGTPADIEEGTALSEVQLNASSPVAGTFSYNPGAGTVLGVGSHPLTATLHSTDTNYVDGKTATVTINVLPGLARIVAPAKGTTLGGSTVTFSWTQQSGATSYQLWLGRSAGSHDLGVIGTTQLSGTVTTLPTDGSQIYVTLYGYAGGKWTVEDTASYTAATLVQAQILSPAKGATLTGSTATFTWSAETGATSYQLWLGRSAGTHDLAVVGTTQLSGTVTTLPTDGSTIYATLNGYAGGKWTVQDAASYTALNLVKAAIQSPAEGATLAGSTVTFSWTAETGATSYQLWLGRTAGAHDLAVVGTAQLSATATGLPIDGSPVYATLNGYAGGKWTVQDSKSYTAASLNKATIISPEKGSTLTGSKVTFSWTAETGATSYQLWLGRTAGAHDLAVVGTTQLSGTATTLPTDGSPVYVTLYGYTAGGWAVQDTATYTAFH